jgi:hypothetical protein
VGIVPRIIYFDEPPIAERLFASTMFAWLWLILRLYLGREWFVSGWSKTFGGTITWKFWQWGESQYSLTGTANCGWVRDCVLNGKNVPKGSAVQALPTRRSRTRRDRTRTSPIRGTWTS